MILVLLFWCAALLVVYAYAGYPLLLALLRLVRRRPVRTGAARPPLTVIVAMHNGAAAIRDKLADLLRQDYPREGLQILVASDGCTDEGPGIVAREFAASGVEVVRLPERGGKERAQKAAIARAQGEIVVFTDMGTRMDPHGLSTIVRSFADPTVGCVSSTDRFLTASGQPAGEGLYVRYEMLLRRLETDVGSLCGLSGSFFAARREVLADFSERLPSDFCTVLGAVRRGLRGVIDPEAAGYYRDVARSGAEFDRKIRTVLRGLTAFWSRLELLNVARYGLFSWQLLSHKLIRWLVPFGMLAAWGASGALALTSPGYRVLFGLQTAAYLFSALAALFPRLAAGAPGRALHYFVVVNVSILVAWSRFLRGQRTVMWTPTTR